MGWGGVGRQDQTNKSAAAVKIDRTNSALHPSLLPPSNPSNQTSHAAQQCNTAPWLACAFYADTFALAVQRWPAVLGSTQAAVQVSGALSILPLALRAAQREQVAKGRSLGMVVKTDAAIPLGNSSRGSARAAQPNRRAPLTAM